MGPKLAAPKQARCRRNCKHNKLVIPGEPRSGEGRGPRYFQKEHCSCRSLGPLPLARFAHSAGDDSCRDWCVASRERYLSRSLMNVTDAVRSRHSIRGFLDKPVPESVLREVLGTAARAASGGNLQPWRIYAVAGAPLTDF